MTTFVNEPLLELRRATERERLLAALAGVDRRLPVDVPVIVGGDARSAPTLDSVDPGAPERVVARATVATAADVDAAVAAAAGALRTWGRTPAAERAAALARAAGILRGRRLELAALAVRECGKPWVEADADVCEAIDFLEYYALEAVALEAGQPLPQVPGERNTLRHRPRGVTAVIAPWNFPFAITAGMTVAALATGNTVCLKPAEQSPGCALAIVQALVAAGVPRDAVALLPGEGETGARLASHPAVRTIAFTGSVPVGLELLRHGAEPIAGRLGLARVIAEMGGKNCIIVDADADLDDVVPAVLASAFGFAGQKCSAASRVLVHERVARALEHRIAGALETLMVGQAEVFGVDVPPVIDGSSRQRIEDTIAEAVASGATVVRGGDPPPGDGHFVPPALVSGGSPDSRVVREEIFGPVLHIAAVPSVAAACEVVDALPYALTGALFSRDPRTIAEVVARTPVGNLYVNRGTTGARVGRQPFGGHRLSGTGTQAGGPEYLLSFVEPVAVTENTVRHGLAF